MIKINNKEFKFKYYPSGECLLNASIPNNIVNNMLFCIEWLWESNEELLLLIYLVEHINENKIVGNHNIIKLFMPYCPYARMDRVKNCCDVFTLKYFSKLINELHFDEVEIIDPHSDVCMALINNSIDISKRTRNKYIYDLFRTLNVDYVCFPDTGCEKRLKDIELPSLTGFKERDWETGEIKSLKILGVDIINKESFDVLIVDDICSMGGTFYYTAKELKKLGARNIYLYVSHCEKNILYGEFEPYPYRNLQGKQTVNPEADRDVVSLLDTGLIDKVFTLGYIAKTLEYHPLIEFLQ